MTDEKPTHRAARRRPTATTWLLVSGALLIVAALVIAGVALSSAMSKGDNEIAHQNAISVEKEWSASVSSVKREQFDYEVGDVVGILRVPKFGAQYQVPIVYGTRKADLEKGVGIYTGLALPGEDGNLAIAGHRTGPHQTLYDLPELKNGDKVMVETKNFVYTYKITKPSDETIVTKNDTWVLNKPSVPKGTKRSLTLTTCAELFPNSPKRAVAFGVLESARQKG